jgi:hypothetical protein
MLHLEYPKKLERSINKYCDQFNHVNQNYSDDHEVVVALDLNQWLNITHRCVEYTEKSKFGSTSTSKKGTGRISTEPNKSFQSDKHQDSLYYSTDNIDQNDTNLTDDRSDYFNEDNMYISVNTSDLKSNNRNQNYRYYHHEHVPESRRSRAKKSDVTSVPLSYISRTRPRSSSTSRLSQLRRQSEVLTGVPSRDLNKSIKSDMNRSRIAGVGSSTWTIPQVIHSDVPIRSRAQSVSSVGGISNERYSKEGSLMANMFVNVNSQEIKKIRSTATSRIKEYVRADKMRYSLQKETMNSSKYFKVFC